MIVVTGATGNVGREAVRLLAAAGEPVRALVRHAPASMPAEVDVVTGDFDDAGSLDRALRGADTVVLISPAVPQQEIALIDVARSAGVSHVVKITSKASPRSPVERRRGQAVIEAHLQASGLDWTLLRNNAYQQNLLTLAPAVRASRSFAMSAGDGEVGMVDARDVAAVAVQVATSPSAHIGRTYWPTGPQLVTYGDVADALSDTVGLPVTYRRVTPDDHLQLMISAGVPTPVAQSNAHAFRLIGDGDAAWVTDDVSTLTGTTPRTMREFITQHRSSFV